MIPTILLLQSLQGRYVATFSHTKRRCRYLVFQDELLRHNLEASLTPFFESVADILFNKFVFGVRSKWWERVFGRLART